MRKRTVRALTGSVILSLLGLPTLGRAQVISVPETARRLVVKITADMGDHVEDGAGIVIGESNSHVVVATAAHVVRPSGDIPKRVDLAFPFAPASLIPVTVADANDSLDMAVILVPKDAITGYRPGIFDWVRKGNLRSLRNGDPMVPLGCPDGVCWEGQSPDPLIGVRGQYILFESLLVSPGSSGGGLFNEYWELVGLVVHKKDIQGTALSIDQVIRQVRAWGHPVSLRQISVPRGGYRVMLGASIFTALGGDDSPFPDDRFPSGRLVLAKQNRSPLMFYLSGLRLAPDQLNANGLLGGVAFTLRRGRFAAHPFAEVGAGRVEGRFDAGGYYVANPNAPGGNEYVPLWRQAKQDGIAFGGGLTLTAVLVPHIVLEGTIGHWSFNVPDSVPKLPSFFIGAGLRWGL